MSSSSSSDDDEGFKGKSNDDWLDTAIGTAGSRGLGSRKQAKMEEKRKLEELNQRLLASRQWKPKNLDTHGNDGSAASASASSSSKSTTHSISNDFGVSWMQRALDRVYQQAKEQKLPPEEVAAERWGSLDKLKQMLTEAKDKLRADEDSRRDSSSRNRDKSDRGDMRLHERRRGDREDTRHVSKNDNRSHSDHRSERNNEYRHRDRRDERKEQFEKTEDVPLKILSPGPSSKVYTVKPPPATISVEEQVQKDPNEEIECKPLTDSEKNAIHARIVKAEMLGNTKLVQELKTKLERANRVPRSAPKEETKLIKVYKKFNEDEMSIKELFMREKTLGTEKDGQMFAKSSLKSINPHKYNPDDEYDIEPKMKKARDDGLVREEEKKEVECNNCYSKYSKRLVLAFGSQTFLCLGQNEPLVDGHVYIRSMNHVPNNLVAADEDVHEEVDKLKQALLQMYASISKSVIFTECYRKCAKKYDNHMIIECIPIPMEQMTEARLYFKKAILESETEWAINKKLVEFKGKHVSRMVSNF